MRFCSFLTLLLRSLGSSRTFSPPALASAADQENFSATFCPATVSSPPASATALRWSTARARRVSFFARFRLGAPPPTPSPMSTRPKSNLSSAPLSRMGSSDSESESAPGFEPAASSDSLLFRFSAFFSALVFFFFSRHSLALAAFSAVSSAFLATLDASILAFRRNRSSSSRSPPAPSPKDQPAAVGGAPAAGTFSILAAEASSADGSSLARALSPLGTRGTVFLGGVSESSAESDASSSTSSSKSDSLSDSGSSDPFASSSSSSSDPSAPSLRRIFSSDVIAFPGWSLALSAFLEFSFAACLAAALALLVFWNLDHSGFCSSGT